MPDVPQKKTDHGSRWTQKKILVIGGIIVVIVLIGLFAAGILLKPAIRSATTVSAPPASQQAASGQLMPASTTKSVDFSIQPGPQEKCGLTCRQLTPTVTNTGTDTAHNVCITIALYNSGGEIISLNGGQSVQRCVGDMASGESKSEQVIIDADCGMFASKCIGQTLVLKTEATCNEATVRFPDKMIST